jgi:hypothetical protein
VAMLRIKNKRFSLEVSSAISKYSILFFKIEYNRRDWCRERSRMKEGLNI